MIPIRLGHLSSNAMRTFANQSPETVAYINPYVAPCLSDFVATGTSTDTVAVYRYSDWLRTPIRPNILGVVESIVTYQPYR